MKLWMLLTLLCLATAHAALPAPTPAQQEAAAAKKAKADAQAALDKQLLTASMDAVAARWRSRAPSQGWTVHPPVAIAAATPAAPAAGAPVPIKSEKLGTAPPSADVKQHPTQAQPANAPPAVVKKGTPKVENR